MIKFLLMLLELAFSDDSQDTSEGSNDTDTGDLDDVILDDSDESTDDSTSDDSDVPEFFEIDGEKLTIDDIREYKKGFLRQSDYTRKTQEIAKLRREYQEAIELYDYLRGNPELVQKLLEEEPHAPAQNLTIDPRLHELDLKVRTLEIEKALGQIKREFPEANEVEILQIATEKMIPVEDAFEMWKGKNLDKIVDKKVKAQSNELIDNIKTKGERTKTLMKPTGKAPDVTLGLSDAEISFARKVGMTPEEYKKYKTYRR